MNIQVFLLYTVFLLVYLGAGSYVARRGWQALVLTRRSLAGSLYAGLIICLMAVYPVSRLLDGKISDSLFDALTLLGVFWLAALYYFFLIAVLTDMLKLINRYKPFCPAFTVRRRRLFALLTAVFVIVLLGAGAINARQPVTRHYEITIPKTAPGRDTLQVVLVSDIHLSNIITNQRLTRIVNRINQLEPDIVLLAGDIIDHKVDVLVKQPILQNLARLQAPLGTYAVLGNHEYLDRRPDDVIRYLRQANITVLRDEAILINNSFYLAGRDDLSQKRYSGQDRKALPDILSGITADLPLILMDHQPHTLPESAAAGVDLQLSGHTHLGQLFPNNLITKSLYTVDWGYWQNAGLQVIVSCGIGTWGPPVRIGNQPEIVTITVHFVKPEN